MYLADDVMYCSLDFTQVYLDVAKAYNSVHKWAAPQRAEFDFSWWFMGPSHTSEPKGVVLIISPFNCPVMLAMSPLVRHSHLFLPIDPTPSRSALLRVGMLP